MRWALPLCLVLSFSLSDGPGRFIRSAALPPTAVPNANVTPAGTLRAGVLTLALEAKPTMWYPEGSARPGREVAAFAEASRAPLVPGPLIRVSAGTTVRLSIRNTFERDTIVFHVPFAARGATAAEGVDSVVVAPGTLGEVSFVASAPGNYFYRARTNADLDRRLTIGGAMAGALVIDSAATPRPRDRVMVLLASTDSASPTGLPLGDNLIFSINGRSWPNTERLGATVGDSVRWRIINANNDIHPMHLHGFYYRVDAFTNQNLPQGPGGPPPGLMVVTQRMPAFTSMSMTWVPERAGNWLFHCHFQVHVARETAMTDAHAGATHENHALTGMQGLVMGLVVEPRPGSRTVTERDAAPPRRLRLEAVQDSAFPDSAPSMRFVLGEAAVGGSAASTGPGFSPPIVLERGKPVAIMVVNHLNEPTAVHWHGIELDSYSDGVPGFSGAGNRVSPLIAPRDSFEARFTPPRSGTFMYHSHANEPKQHRAGMLGALLVVDSLGSRSSDHAFFLKSNRAGRAAQPVLEVNGRANPDTVTLYVGQPARLRFMSLALLNPNATVSVTTRSDSVRVLRNDSLIVQWRPLAKDGADLPITFRAPRAARQVIGMGETYDFELTPTAKGLLRLEVRGGGTLLARVPVRVE
jgi:FtsP/CotA-like multicopper oxidase with cupredoxin domain